MNGNIVQQKAFEYALGAIQLSRIIPKTIECQTIYRQFIRAATSVGANIEEALGAHTKKDFTYSMNVAKKEARESHYWLRLLKETQSIVTQQASLLEEHVREIMKLLTSIVLSASGKGRNNS